MGVGELAVERITDLSDGPAYTIGIVSGAHFFSHVFIITFPPLFPLLVSDFSLTNAQLGLILSVMSVPMLLQFPVGGLVDRIGGKWVLVVGQIVTAVGILLAGFATSYLALLAFSALSGIGQASYHPADFAILDAVAEDSTEGKTFGIHMFGGNLGFAVGPIAIGGVGVAFGWQTALIAVGAAGVGYALFTAIALDDVSHEGSAAETSSSATSLRETMADHLTPTFLALFAFVFLLSAAHYGIQGFLTVFFVDGLGRGATLGNTTLTLFFAAVSIGILVGGFLADRYTPKGIVLLTTLIGAVCLWLATASGEFVAVVIGLYALIGFVFGISIPPRDRLINAASAEGATGTSFGFVLTGIPVAGLFAPWMLGALIDATTVWLAFYVIGALFFLSALVVMAFRT